MREDSKVTLFRGLWVNDREYNLKVLLFMMAVEIVLSYSPFGFITFRSISITTMYIGVMAAALWGGPLSGGAVGLVFGLCSMWKASVTATAPGDLLFAPAFSGDPAGSIILALAPRMLFGMFAGLVFYFLLRFVPVKFHIPALVVSSIFLDRMQSMLTYLFMEMTFHTEGITAMKAFQDPFSEKRLKTYAIVIIIMTAVYFFYDSCISKRYYEEFREDAKSSKASLLKNFLILAGVFMVVVFSAAHLWERERVVVVDIDHIDPDSLSAWRLNQVFLQFLTTSLAALSMAVTLFKHIRNVEENNRMKAILQLEMEKERARELEERAMLDPLTGAANRARWEKEALLLDQGSAPYAILAVDIDNFKGKNDQYGHDIGDEILKVLVKYFHQELKGGDMVFRFGGDEFVILLPYCIKENAEVIRTKVDRINELMKQRGIDKSLPAFSISAGLAFSDETKCCEEIYKNADIALYRAKEQGKDCCSVYE